MRANAKMSTDSSEINYFDNASKNMLKLPKALDPSVIINNEFLLRYTSHAQTF